MKSWVKMLLWFPLAGGVLGLSVYSFYDLGKRSGPQGFMRQELPGSRTRPIAFAARPKAVFAIKTAVASEDARPLLINRYLAHYASPMAGQGEYIVKISDRFQLDPYLVVAIAQQESNLGKLMPANCHNAWGWGIHSAGTLCFDSWDEGINTFVSGLAEKYLAYGLRTPEEIMSKYNPTSPDGAWAKGVSQFLADLQSGSW